LDFVTADSTAGTITIRRGRGDGTFRPATKISVGSKPVDVLAADFNKDGKLDLAVALMGENRVVSFKGDGAGGFTQAGSVGTGSLASNHDFAVVRLVSGDFDGDGKIDLAIDNPGDSTISVLRGKGTGAFYYRINTGGLGYANFPNVKVGLSGLAAADLDGDKKTDLVVSSYDVIDVLLASSGGHFTLKQQFSPSNTSNLADMHDIAIADLNGDKILDLALVNGSYDDVRIFRGTGGGNFADAGAYGVSVWPVGIDRGPAAIATGDFNKDGAIDLAVANTFIGTRTILVNDGSGGFAQKTESPFVDDGEPPVLSPYTPVDIVTGDFAKDGKTDVLVVNKNLNNVTLMKNTTA
jgi:hypothetical protein